MQYIIVIGAGYFEGWHKNIMNCASVCSSKRKAHTFNKQEKVRRVIQRLRGLSYPAHMEIR